MIKEKGENNGVIQETKLCTCTHTVYSGDLEVVIVCRVIDNREDVCRQWKGVCKQLSGSAHLCVQVVFHLEWSCNDNVSALCQYVMSMRCVSALCQSEGAPQNVLNLAPPRICFLSDIMLHIGALSALTPRGSDLTAEN